MAKAHHALAHAAGALAGMLARRKIVPAILQGALADVDQARSLLDVLCKQFPVREPRLPLEPPG
jgi:hypothetical protein